MTKYILALILALGALPAQGAVGDKTYGVSDAPYGADWGTADKTAPSKKQVRALWQTLGAAATKNVGTTAGTVAAGDDNRFFKNIYNPATSAELTTALSAAGAAGGGIVNVPAGTLVGQFTIPAKVSLVGKGMGVSILQLPAGSSGNMISLGDYATIEGLTLDGNKVAQTSYNYGILAYIKTGVKLIGVEVKNCTGIGVGLHTCTRPLMTGCYIHDGSKQTDTPYHPTPSPPGIWLYECIGASITDTTASHNGLDGIIINSDNVTISGGYYDYNGEGMTAPGDGGGGVYLDLGRKDVIIAGVHASHNTGIGVDIPDNNKNILVTGCTAGFNNNAGFLFVSVYKSTFTGNIAFNNGQNSHYDNQDTGFVVNGGGENTITGNISYDDQAIVSQKYGFLYMGSLRNTKAVGNVAYNNTINFSNSAYGTGNEIDLADHVHTNKATLDGTTASFTTAQAAAITANTAKISYPSADAAKLAGIAVNANNYVHPATHSPSIITQDTGNRFVTDSEKSTWNGKENAGLAATLDGNHLSAFTHGDIAHANRTALDLVSGVNTGDQDPYTSGALARAGHAGGQTTYCGTDASDGCTWISTSNATKGVQDFGGVMAINEVTGTVTITGTLEIQ